MPNMPIYLLADTETAEAVNADFTEIDGMTTFYRGVSVTVDLYLYDLAGTAYPEAVLRARDWSFVISNDFDSETPPQLRAASVEAVGGNRLQIVLSQMNTVELNAALGTEKALQLGAELTGKADGVDDWVMQFNCLVRNRRESAGNPSPVEREYYRKSESDERYMRSGDISALADRVEDAENAIGALGEAVSGKADKAVATPEADGLMSAGDKEKLDGIDPSGINPYTIIANPVAEIPVRDNSYGVCQYLDATFTRLRFAYNINNLRRVRLQIVSANPAVTGNIVLIPVVNGISREPVVIPVGATLAKVAFALELDFGQLELRRDITDSRDTLKDVTTVTAIVTNVALEVLSTWE